MSKKSGTIKTRIRVHAGTSRRVIVISLVLTLLGAGMTLARWSSLDQKHGKKSGEMTTQSFSPGSPSKEYVYVGGRLLATEECSYSIFPVDAFYSQIGGAGIVNLTAGAGCPWTASSNSTTWLSISSATSGSGSQQISYLVANNSTGVPRQGTLTIAGLTFTVTQEGITGECTYSIHPTFASFGASGGSGSVSVFTEERCAWQAATNADWVTVTSGCCGIGNGTVSYSVGVNTTGSSRNAPITIGDKTFTVKQKAT